MGHLEQNEDEVLGIDANEAVNNTPDLGSTTLSEREKEVLLLAGQGMTDKEIALRLEIGPKTVRTYWDRMRAKMGAASRTEVLAKALQSAYEELAASEHRIRMFVQHMPVLFTAFDEHWNVISANDEVERVTGYPPEDVLERPWFSESEIPDAEERAKVLRALAELRGDFRDVETELVSKSGEKRSIAWSSRASQSPIPGWASWAIGLDVTERKRAQEALRVSEESLRKLLESSEQGVWMIDTRHVTTFVNKRLAEMLGTTVEMMVGKPAFFREGQSGELLRDMLTSAPAGGGRMSFTTKFKRPDGSDLWAQVSVNPLYTGEGTLSGHAAVLTDVSSRKRAEEARDQLRQSYANLLNHVSDRILRFNRDLACVYANFELDRTAKGESPMLEGRAWKELKTILSPVKEWESAIRSVLASGERTYLSSANIGQYGSSAVTVLLLPEPGAGGTIGHVLAIASSSVDVAAPVSSAGLI